MDVFETIKIKQSQLRREPNESDGSFAKRLYDVHAETIGRELYLAFEELPSEVRQNWIKAAQEHV